MSSLYVSEFRNLPITDNDVAQFSNAAEWVVDQVVSIGGTSTASQAFNAATRFVLLSSDSTCSIAWTMPGASTATAATTNLRIPANVPILFGVQAGMRVSAISNT